MEPTDLAKAFKALGDPTRLRIFEFLADCHGRIALNDSGDASPVCGPTVGEVCCHITGIEKATSTISFHLKELREAGLISMEKSGRHLICEVKADTIAQLANYFQSAKQLTLCC